MTALVGLWHFDGRPDAGKSCDRMLAAQKLYGPHATSCWDGGAVALGRALFRVLPEDTYDQQPIVGGGGRFVLVADLRLDNRDELLADLRQSAEQGHTLCDAAILMLAFERWGEACLDHIVGDFAFVLWDGQVRKLLLVRDPLGQRPLHYHRGPGFLAIASMPKGLHALGVARAPDEERVAEYLVLLPEQGPRTFFRDIARVEAGQIVTVTASGISPRRYWEPTRKPIRLKNTEAYAEALRHHLDVATRARLRSRTADVGAHLSAGLDSSVVATSAALALAPLGGRVVAFTGVPNEGYTDTGSAKRIADEGPMAASTAALHPNIEHVLVRTPAGSPLDDLDRYFYLFEQPVTNLCNGGWVNAINETAHRRGLTVMLTGTMGNMTISYNGMESLPQYLAQGRWLRWAREVAALQRSGHLRFGGALVQSVGPWLPRFVWTWLNRKFRRVNLDPTSHSAINPLRLEELDLQARARERNIDLTYRPRKCGFETRLWVLRRIDMGNFNKGTLAGWGIDLRDPTADRRLIDFCLNIPAEQFLSGGVTRALTRHAFVGRIPAAVLNETRRGLQGADWHVHLNAARSQVSEEVSRLEDSEPAVRALDVQRLQKLVATWPQNGWEHDAVTISYRMALLRAISTGHFLRKASGSNR